VRKPSSSCGAPPPIRLPDRGAYSANQFDLSGIVPGDYAIQVSAVSGERSFFAFEDVTVGIANLRLTALPSVSLTGAVRFVTASGQPRPHVNVRLFPDSGTLQWDAAGDTFTVSDVIPRKYRVSANAGPAAYVRSMKFQDRDVLEKEFVLSTPGNLEIVLADDFGTIDGNVTDSDGNPVAAIVFQTFIQLPASIAPGARWGRFQTCRVCCRYCYGSEVTKNAAPGLSISNVAAPAATSKPSPGANPNPPIVPSPSSAI
jgi:hypothetical protein